MALKLWLVALLLALVVVVAEPSSLDQWGSLTGLAATGYGDGELTCNGQIGGCIEPEEEMMMESEGARRQMLNKNQRFISYAALRKNNIPCGRRGQSYYNCRRNVRANPYRRGCSVITRCHRYLY